MAPPNSPPEREVTAPMHDISADVGFGAAALPHNISSWELLDVETDGDPAAFSGSSPIQAGRRPTCVEVAVDHEDGGGHALQASAATKELRAASGEPPAALLQLFDTESRHTADDTPSEHAPSGTPAPKGREHHRSGVGKLAEAQYSFTRSVSTVWSLLSTTSQAHLPVASTGHRPVLGPKTTATPKDAYCLGIAVTEATSTGQPGAHEQQDHNINSLHASSGMAGTWRVDSLPSSLPLAPQSIGVSHSSYEAATEQASHGTGASSSEMPIGAVTNAILIPRVISVATTSLASEGELCMGESRRAGVWTPVFADTSTLSDQVAMTSIASSLPSPSQGALVLPEDSIRRLGEEVAARETQVAAVAMALEGQLELDGPPSMPPSPSPDPGTSAGPRCECEQPAELLAWLMKPLVSLCDHRPHPCTCEEGRAGSGAANTPDTGLAGSASAQSRQCEQRRAAAWLSRRMSFISSSSLATSPLPSAMPSTTFPSAAAPATSAVSSSIFTLESSLLWSQACIVCAGSSQRALKGLHQLCDYVWQDLKNHWYPQLRLVLGDHSSARKIRYGCRARRRFEPKRTSENGESATATSDAPTETTAGVSPAACGAASASRVEAMRYRSVSSPCFFNGDVRITNDSAAHPYMSWRDRAATAATFHLHASNSNSTNSSGASSPLPSQSTKEGMRLYAVMTAEAVASAAQGLLVFLL